VLAVIQIGVSQDVECFVDALRPVTGRSSERFVDRVLDRGGAEFGAGGAECLLVDVDEVLWSLAGVSYFFAPQSKLIAALSIAALMAEKFARGAFVEAGLPCQLRGIVGRRLCCCRHWSSLHVDGQHVRRQALRRQILH
jgi:hypothetical protein